MKKISHVKIENFRNLGSCVEYDLKNVNIFAGPNYSGKTNTILAIYWCLTGYQLDGSSQDDSNLPQSDKKLPMSVELKFDDGFTVKRGYAEKWVKKRGSEDITLEGHTTDIYINETKENISVGTAKLIKYLGTDIELDNSKFDLLRALIDPRYLGYTVEWKVLRAFIINLVGDVDNDDVIKELDKTAKYTVDYKKELESNNYDTASIIKRLKSSLKKNNDDVKGKKAAVKELKQISDVDPEELKKAQDEIEIIENQISSIRANANTDPALDSLKSQLGELREEYNATRLYDIKEFDEKNKDIRIKKNKIQSEIDGIKEQINKEKDTIFSIVSNKNSLIHQLNEYEEDIKHKELELNNLRDIYSKIAQEHYITSIKIPEADNCPNCGYVLNGQLIDQVKSSIMNDEENFNIEKSKKLAANVESGKKLKLDIENLKFKISSANEEIAKLDTSNHDEAVLKLNDKLESLNVKMSEMARNEATEPTESKELIELSNQIEAINKEIDNHILNSANNSADDKIRELKIKKSYCDQTCSAHENYLQIMNRVEMINNEIKNINKKIVNIEQLIICIEQFTQIKLNMLNDHVVSVFPEVEFVLVESNIKEGSWNEVCYPLIKGKKTEFKLGSDSEQIITGIYLIECIKWKKNLDNLPIIFDRCEGLDTKTLNERISTSSQIITARVDGDNFDKVTLLTDVSLITDADSENVSIKQSDYKQIDIYGQETI